MPQGVGLQNRLRLGDDERQVHHAAVDGDRLVLVPGVAELLEVVDDGLGVVLHQAPDIPEPEPEVRDDAVSQVAGRDARVLGSGLPGIVGGDLGDVRGVERAVVLPALLLGPPAVDFVLVVLPSAARLGRRAFGPAVPVRPLRSARRARAGTEATRRRRSRHL